MIATAGLVAAAFAPDATAALRCARRVRPRIRRSPRWPVQERCSSPTRRARRGWALGVRQTAVPLGGTIAAVTYPVLFALGGVELAMLGSAAAVAATGAAFAFVAGDDRQAGARAASAGPFRTILAAPGLRRLLAVAACYIVVLQALLAYIVPAVRAAGHSELTAAIAYFAINVAAMVAAHRLGEDRRPRRRHAAGAHARRGRPRGRRWRARLRRRAARVRAARGGCSRGLRSRCARLERARLPERRRACRPDASRAARSRSRRRSCSSSRASSRRCSGRWRTPPAGTRCGSRLALTAAVGAFLAFRLPPVPVIPRRRRSPEVGRSGGAATLPR